MAHDSAMEVWVGFYKKESGKRSITYPEAVDQALCYGWIRASQNGVRFGVIAGGRRDTPAKARR